LKEHSRSWFDALRQRLIFTPEEKRVVLFILVAVVLGLLARHYRDQHPFAAPPAKIDKKHSQLLARNVSPAPLSSPKRERKKRADVSQ
jgi:hypothetical protein